MGRGSDSGGSSRRSRTPTPPMTPPGGTRRMSAQLKSIEAELTKMTQEVRLDTEASNKALVRSLMGTTEAPQSAKEEEKSKTVCSQCGTKYKEDAKHCKRCGNKRPEEKKAQQTKRIIPSDFFLDLSQEVDELLKGVLRDSGAKEVKSPFMSRPGTSPEKEQEHRAQMTPPLTDGDRTPKSATPRTIGPTDTVTTIYPEGQQGDGASVQEESPSGTKRSLPEQNPSKGFSETGITEAETAADSPEKGGVGFQNWLRTGNEDDEEDMTPGGLLNFSTQDLLEDLRGAESLTWAEQRHAEDEEAERALALASMAEEKHFWEVDRRELSEDQENFYEIEQAIWRLRKWLRKKYGSAEKAWKVLETTCTAPWSKGKDKAAPVQARAADCLTFAEIKIAMSRLGINLPHITGYEKVKTLLQAIDDNGSRNITFRELMGDDDDPTILHEEPPPEKIPWETGLVQPRWATRWESGLFDKELEEHCITRDAHRPTRPKFDTSNAKKPDGYVPIYKRYKKVMEEKMAFKKKSYEMRRAKEMEGCTFAPNFVKRSRSAPAEPTTKKEGELSYRNKNLIEYLAKKEKDSEKCTFRPELCQRSNQIIALMREGEQNRHDESSAPGAGVTVHYHMSLTMHITPMVLVTLACLACMTCGHRLQKPERDVEGRRRASSQAEVSQDRAGNLNGIQTLRTLLLSSKQAAGYNPSSTGAVAPMGNPSLLRLRSEVPVMSNVPDEDPNKDGRSDDSGSSSRGENSRFTVDWDSEWAKEMQKRRRDALAVPRPQSRELSTARKMQLLKKVQDKLKAKARLLFDDWRFWVGILSGYSVLQALSTHSSAQN